MPEPLLKVQDVHTYYGPLHVLKGVNYDLYEGEIVCLLGGNASGKSTTMKTVLGLVKPTQGQVVFNGERIDRLAKQSGFEGRLVILAEPNIETGDCRIEWADGGVVLERAAIEAKIDELVGRYIASRNQAVT